MITIICLFEICYPLVVVRSEHSHSFIDSLDNQSTASGPASCRRRRPPGNAVSGHSPQICLVVWWLSPQLQAGNAITAHRCRDCKCLLKVYAMSMDPCAYMQCNSRVWTKALHYFITVVLFSRSGFALLLDDTHSSETGVLSFWEDSFTRSPVHESCNKQFTKCLMLVTMSTEWVTRRFGLKVRRRLDWVRHLRCTYDTDSQSVLTCVVGWKNFVI